MGRPQQRFDVQERNFDKTWKGLTLKFLILVHFEILFHWYWIPRFLSSFIFPFLFGKNTCVSNFTYPVLFPGLSSFKILFPCSKISLIFLTSIFEQFPFSCWISFFTGSWTINFVSKIQKLNFKLIWNWQSNLLAHHVTQPHHPIPTPQKLITHFQATKEADFWYATLF